MAVYRVLAQFGKSNRRRALAIKEQDLDRERVCLIPQHAVILVSSEPKLWLLLSPTPGRIEVWRFSCMHANSAFTPVNNQKQV